MFGARRSRGDRSGGPLLGLFLLAFLTYGYFYQSGQHNENARLGQVAAIVDYGTLDLPPRLRGNTADVVRYEDKIFPNKAPGTSLIAVPSYWLSSRALRQLGLPETLRENLVCHLTIWTTVGLASSLLVVLLYVVLERATGSSLLALVGTLAYGLGTIAFPFATLFFSHQLAAALCFGAFGLLFLIRHPRGADVGTTGRAAPRLVPLAAGLCAGYALTTEYPTLLAVGPICLYALVALPGRRAVVWFGAGLMAGAGVLAAYNWLAFGKIYHIPYAGYAQTGKFAEHELGYMGVRLPHWNVVKEITFGPMRGLFYVNPWLVLVLPGLLVPVLRRELRREMLLCAFVVLAFFVFNAGYGRSIVFWGGGASVGPRHVLPMLPFAVFLIAPLLRRRALRWPFYGAALASVAIMLMATATEPRVPYDYRNPLTDLFWDGYVEGRLSIHHFGPFSDRLVTEDSVAFTPGKLAGLPPRLQLLPLLVLWAGSFAWLVARIRGPERAAPAPDAPESHLAATRVPAAWRGAAPAYAVGAFLLGLFLLPFVFGGPEVAVSGEGYGLRGRYVRGLVWNDPNDGSPPPEDRVAMTRVDRFLAFPWHHASPPLESPFSVEWTGAIYAPEAGRYVFATESDDGSTVWVDGRLVVNNWGKHPRQRRQQGIPLTKGLHPITIRYYNVAQQASLYLLWSRPGKHLQPIAKNYLLPDLPNGAAFTRRAGG